MHERCRPLLLKRVIFAVPGQVRTTVGAVVLLGPLAPAVYAATRLAAVEGMQRENGYCCDRSSSARPRETPTIESAPRCRQWATHSRLDEVARKPRQRVESHGISPLPASWYRAIWSDGTRTHRGAR